MSRSVWRPLVDIVEDHPLALCDARTANVDDIIEVSFVDRGYIRPNFMAKYNKNFRFCYLGGMHSDEMCIFKVFDSKDGVAKGKLTFNVFLYTGSQTYSVRSPS